MLIWCSFDVNFMLIWCSYQSTNGYYIRKHVYMLHSIWVTIKESRHERRARTTKPKAKQIEKTNIYIYVFVYFSMHVPFLVARHFLRLSYTWYPGKHDTSKAHIGLNVTITIRSFLTTIRSIFDGCWYWRKSTNPSTDMLNDTFPRVLTKVVQPVSRTAVTMLLWLLWLLSHENRKVDRPLWTFWSLSHDLTTVRTHKILNTDLLGQRQQLFPRCLIDDSFLKEEPEVVHHKLLPVIRKRTHRSRHMLGSIATPKRTAYWRS